MGDQDLVTVVLGGRGYPSPEEAKEAMRASLARDGIDITVDRIEARRWTDKGICPWEAVAYLTRDEYAIVKASHP